jgi:hypothetical protein
MTHMAHVIPWHPCRYDCPRSIAAAARIWFFLESFLPALAGILRESLTGTVLYRSQWEFWVLEGQSDSNLECGYGSVRPTRSLAEPRLDDLVRAGDRVILGKGGASVYKRGRLIGGFEGEGSFLISFA